MGASKHEESKVSAFTLRFVFGGCWLLADASKAISAQQADSLICVVAT